jgi:TRAP-type C4-dicarboxylate transport system permease small subunit
MGRYCWNAILAQAFTASFPVSVRKIAAIGPVGFAQYPFVWINGRSRMDESDSGAGKSGGASGLDKLMFAINRIASGLSIMAFTLMLIDVLAGVVMRYVLQIPFPWGEEAARYLMVTGIMVGIGIGVREGAHLNVELFRSFLPSLPRFAVMLFADSLTACTYFFLVFISYRFISINKSFGQVTASLNVPMYYIYYILLIGFMLTGIEQLFSMYGRFVRKDGGGEADEEKREEFGI